MAGSALVEVVPLGDGAARFAGRLNGVARRIEEMPLAAAGVFKALEQYYEARWGEGVEDTQATDLRWPDHSPLHNTGALKDSMTKSDAEGAVRVVSPWLLEFGTKLFYGRFLQRGTSKMKAKPVMRDPLEVSVIIDQILRKWVMSGAEGAAYPGASVARGAGGRFTSMK